MKPDTYTKAVLTVIALALLMIVCNQYAHPTVVHAQGAFAGVQFNYDRSSGGYFFDARTGEVWNYSAMGPQLWGRLTKLGQPLAK